MSTADVRALRACLRQLGDAGCRELVFATLTAADALALARAARTGVVARTVHVAPAPAATTAVDVLPVPELTPLAALAADASGCVRCRLHEQRRSVVFGEGPAAADVVIVGEAPGQEEDRTGRPFVGRAGRLLDLLLMSVGLPRDAVYICNVLKCRPPQNRNPAPDEVDACTTSFLHRQLEAIAPQVIVAVGKFAAQVLLQTDEAIGRLRGQVHAYRGTPLVVSYHPAFLLRSPHMCRVAWHDFQLVRQVLDEQG